MSGMQLLLLEISCECVLPDFLHQVQTCDLMETYVLIAVWLVHTHFGHAYLCECTRALKLLVCQDVLTSSQLNFHQL